MGWSDTRRRAPVGISLAKPTVKIVAVSISIAMARVLTRYFFKPVVIFPNPSVCCIYGTCPVFPVKPCYCSRDGTLQFKCRKSRNLTWKIVVRCSIASYCSYRKYKITKCVLLFEPSAFSKEKNCIRVNCTQKIHNCCCIGTAHTEIYDSYPIGCGTWHVFISSLQPLHCSILQKDQHSTYNW